MSRLLNGLRAQGAALRASRRGTIPVLFGLSLIPLIGMIGLSVDYGIATTNKTKLDLAADAAAIAAVVTAKAYIADNAGQANVSALALAAGSAKAVSAFNVNTGNITFGQVTLATPQVTRTAQTLTAVVSYNATVKNTFGPIFGSPTTALSNSVTASTDIASYLDFYLLLDVSGSMGLPTTDDGMTALADKNNDLKEGNYRQGCQFACHFPGRVGWGLAAGKIQLRSDAVNLAVCSLIRRAGSPLVPNQYRVGLYPFINQMATLAAITSNVATLSATAQCGVPWPLTLTNLLDTGTTQLYTNGDPSTGTGSGGTLFDTVLPQMKSAIATFGDGTTTNSRKPFVFLITDGMQNDQNHSYLGQKRYYPGDPSKFSSFPNAGFDGSRPKPIDPSKCSDLKSSGVTVSVLYIPYNNIKFQDFGGPVADENKIVNGFSPGLATPLRTCASPGFFYTANTPADITASLNAMFDQALRVARLTQ